MLLKNQTLKWGNGREKSQPRSGFDVLLEEIKKEI